MSCALTQLSQQSKQSRSYPRQCSQSKSFP